jgi:hypothetical protein
LVTSIGPSPVRGFIAAIAHPHPVVIRQLAGSIIPYHLVAASVGSFRWDASNEQVCGQLLRQPGALRVDLVGPRRRWREAADHVIVDQADRLHSRVGRCRADKAEPKTLELSGHSDRLR